MQEQSFPRVQFKLQFRIMYQNDKAWYNSLNHVPATCGAEMSFNDGAHVHARYDDHHDVLTLFVFRSLLECQVSRQCCYLTRLSFMIVAQYSFICLGGSDKPINLTFFILKILYKFLLSP